jgi:hypothetical protein
MPVAQLLRQIGDLPLDLGLLPGQLLNGRRAEHVGRRLRVAGGPDHLANLVEARIGRGPLGAGDDQLRVEICDLLRDQGPFLALQKAGAAPVLLDRTFRLRDLLAEVLELDGEPLIRPPRRLEFRIQLRDDVGVGHGIGDARRLVGRLRREIDDDGARLALDADRKPLEKSVDDLFVLAGAALLVAEQRIVVSKQEGEHDFRQVRRERLFAVGDELGQHAGGFSASLNSGSFSRRSCWITCSAMVRDWITSSSLSRPSLSGMMSPSTAFSSATFCSRFSMIRSVFAV